MNILHVTSELVPFFKLGGLGDVSYALPVALSEQKAKVSVALPFYDSIQLKNPACLGALAIDYDGKREMVFVFKTTLPKTKVTVYLFRHPLFNEYKAEDMTVRFGFYAKSVTAFYLYAQGILHEAFDVVHCHDWHTSLVPFFMGENNKTKGKNAVLKTPVLRETKSLQAISCKTILTIHNLLYQGVLVEKDLVKLGISPSLLATSDPRKGPVMKSLEVGIKYVDRITTVSPTYASEIVTNAYGVGLGELLKTRQKDLVGILNGIDVHVWNPERDVNLIENYSKKTVINGKQTGKRAIQKALGLPEFDVPLFGFVGRLELRQKGIDILYEAVHKLHGQGCPYQLIIMGTGNEEASELMSELGHEFRHVVFINTFDERLARRIYAGSDCMLVPSKFEPCGLTQMIAMRYGTIPLVRNTGGLSDSVIDKKTGFVFDDYSGDALASAMKVACHLFTTDQKQWKTMILHGMAQDFTWKKSAQAYRALYAKILQNQ